MEVFVFYETHEKLLLLTPKTDLFDYSNMFFFNRNIFDAFTDGDTIDRETMKLLTNNRIEYNNHQYKIAKFHDDFIIYPIEEKKGVIKIAALFFNSISQKNDYYIAIGVQLINQFNFFRSSYILNFISKEDTNLSEALNVLSQYHFCHNYNMIIYNQLTKYFSVIESSFDIETTFFHKSDAVIFKPFFNISTKYISYVPEELNIINNIPSPTKSISAIKIDLHRDYFGILLLFHEHDNFRLPDDDKSLSRYIIDWEFLFKYIKYDDALNTLEKFIIENYQSGELVGLLQKITCEICNHLGYEACSILLKNSDKEQLDLIATCDSEMNGKPLKEVHYFLHAETFTSEVYNSNKMKFSYDIKNDPKNSHFYNEKTCHKPKNWIGIPLKSKGERYGVLRVKNKVDNSDVIDFFPLDFLNLNVLCNRISNIINIDTVYTKIKDVSEVLQARYTQLTEFNNIFLHEIRNPISKFNTTPNIIDKLISEKPLSEENIENAKLKLFDIKIMGERLKFITDKQYVEEMLKGKKDEVLSVMQEIVFPIVNITREFLRKQYDINIVFDAEGLEGFKVVGDRNLLNLVLNSLIDNAGKYTIDTSKPVTITGKCDEKFKYFYIGVSSYSYPIEKTETTKLFEKGYRGKRVSEQKIIGTGIGLYISKKIMQAHNGDLTITSIKDPVAFEMRIPYIENTGEDDESNSN